MATKFHQPVRMCISCRQRYGQNELYRLRCEDTSLETFEGFGRSFYICNDCVLNEKKVLKALMRQCKSGDRDKITNRLKEIIADDRKS